MNRPDYDNPEALEAWRKSFFEDKHRRIVDELVHPGDSDHKINPRVKIKTDEVFREIDEKFDQKDPIPWFRDLSKHDISVPDEIRFAEMRFLTKLDNAREHNNGRYVVEERSKKLSESVPVIK